MEIYHKHRLPHQVRWFFDIFPLVFRAKCLVQATRICIQFNVSIRWSQAPEHACWMPSPQHWRTWTQGFSCKELLQKFRNQWQCNIHMGVSNNRGTLKWMVYNGKPDQNWWFRVPLFLETSIYTCPILYACNDPYQCPFPWPLHSTPWLEDGTYRLWADDAPAGWRSLPGIEASYIMRSELVLNDINSERSWHFFRCLASVHLVTCSFARAIASSFHSFVFLMIAR